MDLMDLPEVSDKLELLNLPDDMIIETGKMMDYPSLLEYALTNKRIRFLVNHLLPGKFVEYVRINMKYISAGGGHTAFITDKGRIYVMGNNYYAQLGLGDRVDVNTPSLVDEYDISAVSAGGLHTAFITKRGWLYVMGRNNDGQLGIGTKPVENFPTFVERNVTSVSAGRFHTAFISDRGQLYVMGNNEYGQLGLGHMNKVTTPTLVQGYSYSSTDTTIPAPIEPKIIAVSAGEDHTAFITEQGQLYAMGRNDYRQLGLGDITFVTKPTLVGEYKVVSVSAGKLHTAFITDQGHLYVMGMNLHGELGLGHRFRVLNPTLVEAPTGVEGFKVAAVSAGGYHTAFITDQGHLYAMGSNEYGQLGIRQRGFVATPTLVIKLKVIAVSAGGNHTAFISLQGDVYVMGYNGSGQLGLGHMDDVFIPAQLTIIPSIEGDDSSP